MATTIDKLDLNVYNLYAIRTRMIEQTNQQLRLDQAQSIPPQIQILDSYPKLTELDILLGVTPLLAPWAYFYPPKNFRHKRRSPFGFARILPNFGDQKEQERQEQKAQDTVCEDEEEEQEKQTILNCFHQITKINEWLGYIVGHRGQFLQG